MSNRVKRIYISGPITGREKDEYLGHFTDAEWALKRRACDAGIKVSAFNPASYFETEYDETPPYHERMRKCIAELTQCDGIALLEGWEASSEARMELRVSQELWIPVVYVEAPKSVPMEELPTEALRYTCIHSGVFNPFVLADRFLDKNGFMFVEAKKG